MAFGAEPKDANGIPISSVYAPDEGFTATAGYPGAYQDSNSNPATAAMMQVLYPRIVQMNHAVTSSGGKTLTCAFNNPNIKGNSLVVSVGMGEVEGANITLTITDSNSNTYTEVSKSPQSTTLEAAIFLATYVPAGPNTITATIAGSSSSNTGIGIQIYEVYGLITPMPAFDQSAIGSNAGSTAIATSSVSPLVPNEYAFMAIAAAGGTITAGTNWTLDSGSLTPVGGNLVSFGAQSQALPTMASLTGTATLSISNAWAAALATFRAVILPMEGTVTIANANPNGQATMNNSSPVAIASDQSVLPVKATFVEQASLSAGSLNADLIASTDVSAYIGGWVSLTVTGTWSGALQAQECNDNSNFQQVLVNDIRGTIATGAPSSSISYNATWLIPVYARYLRVRMTSYSSGTANGVAEFYTLSFLPPNHNITVANNISAYATAIATASGIGTNDFHLISAASNNATSIKASSGQVYGYEIYNTNAAVRYVKLYNKASAPAPATDNALLKRTIAVPPGVRAWFHTTNGIVFSTGIALAAVTGIADTDNTSVGANDLTIDLDWF